MGLGRFIFSSLMSRLLKDDPWLVETIYHAKQADMSCGVFFLKVFLFTICCLRVQSCKVKNTEKSSL